MSAIVGLLRADLRHYTRDPMLLALLLVPISLGLALRAGYPLVAQRAPDLRLMEFADVATAITLINLPLLFGMAAGFVLLDERDENVLAAIAVTPLGRGGWLRYRVAVPIAATVLAGFPLGLLATLVPLTVPSMAAIALLLGMEASLVALFLGAFAANKVQGIALAKAAGALVVAPLGALALEGSNRWALAPVPSFWIGELVGSAGSGRFWLLYLPALAVHLLLLLLLLRRYIDRVD